MYTSTIIPARGGSKRIPRKNIRPFFSSEKSNKQIVDHIKANKKLYGQNTAGRVKEILSTEKEEKKPETGEAKQSAKPKSQRGLFSLIFGTKRQNKN